MTNPAVAPNPNPTPIGPDSSRPPAPGQAAIDKAPGLGEGLAKGRKVPKWRLTVPESVRDPERDPTSVTMKELTDSEMMMVAQLAKGDESRLLVEFTKAAIHAVDDVQVRFVDMEGDLYWGKWSAKLRNLLVLAFKKMHSTTDEEDALFFASRKIEY